MNRQSSISTKVSALFMIWLILMLPLASAAVSITNIVVTPSARSAIVSFQTNESATAIVNVANQGKFPLQIAGPSLDHSVAVSGLQPNTKYTFTIDASTLHAANPVTSPQNSFTTVGSSGDIFFESNIPTVTGASRINIVGKTIPDGIVTILVNDKLSASGVASATGDAIFSFDIDTTQSVNTVVVQVVDPTTKVEKDFTSSVQVDTVYPEFTNISIPTISKSTSVKITGTVNKAMSLTTYVKLPSGQEKTFETITKTDAGDFATSVELDDGDSQVLVRGTDATGAQIEKQQTVTVDSQPLDAPSIDFSKYNPVASDTLYIDGFVNKPGIPVRIYVDPKEARSLPGPCTTTSSQTLTGDGSILADTACYGFGKYQQVVRDGAYFEATSSDVPDNSSTNRGLYPFSVKVSLEPRLTIFVQDTLQIKTTTDATTALNGVNQDSRYNAGVTAGIATQYSIFAVAADKVGNVADTGSFTLQKEQCGNSADFQVRIGQVYPDLIQPDLIFQGVAQISFKADLQYTGAYDSNSVVVTGADIVPRDVSQLDLTKLGTDPREILDTSRCTISPAFGITDFVYMVCNLNRFPSNLVRTNITKAYDNLSNIGSIKFPVTFNVDYSYLDANNRTVARTASQCTDITIRFDKRLSPDKYPKGLLKSTVKVLNTTVTAIDQVLKPLNTVKLVTLGACVSSKMYSLFSYANEEYKCFSEGFLPDAQMKIEQALRGCSDLTSCDATKLVNSDGTPIKGKSLAGSKEVEAVGSACVQNIWDRLKTEQTINYVCDRIFCPAVPSASEYIKKVNQKTTSALTSACANSKEAANPTYLAGAQGPVENLDEKSGCGLEYQNTWNSACFYIDPLKESKKQAKATDPRNTNAKSFSDVLTNMNFCTAADRASQSNLNMVSQGGNTYVDYNTDEKGYPCYQLGLTSTQAQSDKYTGVVNLNSQVQKTSVATAVVPSEVAVANGKTLDSNSLSTARCVISTNDNHVIYQFKNPKDTTQPLVFDESEAASIKVTDISGKQVYSPSVVKFTAFDGSQGGLDQEGNYYRLSDDGKVGTLITAETDKTNFFAKVCSNAGTQGATATKYGIVGDLSNTDCKTEITSGPDQLKQNKGAPYIVNPTDGFIDSVKCGCFPAIESYLIVVRNVMNAVKNCFQATLVNSEFKAGACRSLLTTYICDWIYKAIKCLTTFVSGLESVSLNGKQAGGTDTAIGAIQAVQKGADKMSQAMNDRYGNTASYNSLISSRKLINSICLAAFGYDWLPELNAAVSIKGGGAAVNSTAFIVTADRRWQASDPTTGRSTFIYEAGYFISAGSPINYNVYLVCSNDNSCRNVDGYDNSGQCDCAYPGSTGEQKYKIDGGVAEGGSTVGDADGKGQRIVSLSQFDYRFDKVRLVFKDTSSANAQEQIIEQRISRVGGQEPPTCTFSILTFKFQCDYASTNKYGDVFFYGLKTAPSKDPYGINDPLSFAVYAKVDYTKQVGIEKQPITPADQLPKYIRLQVWNEAQTQKLYEEITPRNTLNSGIVDGTPIIMGQNYHIGDGQVAKGIAGTIRATGAPIAITSTDNSLVVPYDTSSWSNSRASNKAIYYVFYNNYAIGLDGTGKIKTIGEPLLANSVKKIYVLRQYAGGATSIQPAADLAAINSLIARQNDPTSSSLATSGTLGIVANADLQSNVLLVDPDNGVTLKLDSNFDNKKSYTAVINYDTQSTSTLLCGPNQKSFNLVVTTSLHDSIAKNKQSTISTTNSDISPAVFVYQGAQQNVSKLITVNCDGTSTTVGQVSSGLNLRSCTANKVVSSADTVWSAVPTSKLAEGCYCGKETTINVFDSLNTGYAACITQDATSFNPTQKAYSICTGNSITTGTKCICAGKSYIGSDITETQLCDLGQKCQLPGDSSMGTCGAVSS